MSHLPFARPVEDSVPKIDGEIAVGEDLEFQARWWRFERGVWIFFCTLLVLALAGVFGRGPAARAHLQTQNGTMKLSYDRIQRTGTPSMLRVELQKPAIQNGQIRIFVSESIVRELGAQRVIPEPLSTTVGDGGYTYTFAASNPPAAIGLGLEPTGPGLFPFTVSMPGGSTVEARIVVLP